MVKANVEMFLTFELFHYLCGNLLLLKMSYEQTKV